MYMVVASSAEAVADIGDGASLAVGGFGMSGVPTVLIAALLEQGATGMIPESEVDVLDEIAESGRS